MWWPCESVSFVVLIESEAAACGWLSDCLSILCVCVHAHVGSVSP